MTGVDTGIDTGVDSGVDSGVLFCRDINTVTMNPTILTMGKHSILKRTFDFERRPCLSISLPMSPITLSISSTGQATAVKHV